MSHRLSTAARAALALTIACSADKPAGDAKPASSSAAGTRIELTRVATLGREGQGLDANVPFVVDQDSNGNYYLSWTGATSVPVFDRTGKLVRQLGKKGSGPGEFLSAGVVHVGRGDTIRVFDSRNARVSVFAADGRLLATKPIGVMIDGATQLQTGEILLNARRPNGRGGNDAALVLDSNGTVVRSFLSVTDQGPALYHDRFVFAPDRDSGRVIAATRQRYEINVWRPDGTLADTIRRSAGWFVIVPDAERRERGLSSSLVGAARAPTGGFWVMGRRTSPNWKRLTSGVMPGGEIGGAAGPPVSELFDSVLELIDQHGDSVAALALPGLGFHLMPAGLLGTYRLRDDGTPIVEIWRPELRTK